MDYDEFLQSVAYDKIADLSATTVALSLSAITLISLRGNWTQDGNPLTDAQWETISNIIYLANGELMSALVGMIFPNIWATYSAFKFLPCDGGIYNESDYPLLYGAIDPVYIISGTQFRVPDLRDRVMLGTGASYAIDDSGGVDNVILTTQQIPPHNHTYDRASPGIDVEGAGVPDPFATGLPFIPTPTSSAGGGEAHENRQPYRAVNFVIVAG